MVEIFTPESWYSIFGSSQITIEDDGRVYKSSEYHNLFRDELAIIDFNNMKVTDYLGNQIGSIEQDGDVLKVYGSDYYRSFKEPLICIRDNTVYDGKDFHTLFPTILGYIRVSEKSKPKSTTTTSRTNDDDDYLDDRSSERYESDFTVNDSFFDFIGAIFIIGCIVGAGILIVKFFSNYMTGSTHEAFYISIIACAISSIFTYKTCKPYHWIDPTLDFIGNSLVITAVIILYRVYMDFGGFDESMIKEMIKEVTRFIFASGIINLAFAIIIGPVIYVLREDKANKSIKGNKSNKRKSKKPRFK